VLVGVVEQSGRELLPVFQGETESGEEGGLVPPVAVRWGQEIIRDLLLGIFSWGSDALSLLGNFTGHSF
jgi:hypothetical protein